MAMASTIGLCGTFIVGATQLDKPTVFGLGLTGFLLIFTVLAAVAGDSALHDILKLVKEGGYRENGMVTEMPEVSDGNDQVG